MEEQKKGLSEDWLALWIGLGIFLLGLGAFVGWEILGWGVKTSVWTDIGKAITPVSAAYKGLSGITSLILTYLFLLLIMLIGGLLSVPGWEN